MRRIAAVLVLAPLMLGSAGCHAAQTARAAHPAAFPLPDHRLTPGAISGTRRGDVCPHVDPALEAGRPTAAVKDKVYQRYHIGRHVAGAYEIDHLVPLELDGSNSIANLWPEPNDHPRSGALNSKDLLENRMHALVCAGRLSLVQAQHEIATDWPAAYRKYMGGV